MDKIRISKVEDVTLWRRGVRTEGTLHLTSHHIIFNYIPTPPLDQLQVKNPRSKELWITYPMISFCTYRPAPPASRLQPSIRLRGRDFTLVAFHFVSELKAREVYDTIRNLTCRLGRLEKLYAFSYQAQGAERDINGWNVYDAVREWRRMGVESNGRNKGWRLSKINTDYEYSPTYPALLPVPNTISDNVLNYAGRYRSRTRIPVLTYLHPVNNCSISRSSQPLVGLRGHRNVQDEKLVAAIFASSKPFEDLDAVGSPVSNATLSSQGSSLSSADLTPPTSTEDESSKSMEAIEDKIIANVGRRSFLEKDRTDDPEPKKYGAQQNNLIVDARPTVNAYAMQAVGMGSENMDHYPFATKAYLGIDNIHVMRESLNRVIEALKDSDVTPLPPNREQLERSGWVKHISNILDGAALIARQVGIHHSHVLIHCSDGWDRTSQLSGLSQLCLDPYYRTLEGFIVLIEKDWLSFGHMFRHRSGFLGSEKWFEIENERIGGHRSGGSDSPFSSKSAGNALENALLSAKGFFNKHNNDSKESLVAESDGEMQPFDSPTSPAKGHSAASRTLVEQVTKVKETSPVFHQFLDATYQLLYQHPTRFEFNERFLRRLLYQLYSCQYGTFLFDNEKQRVEARITERTRSVWDYFLARKEQFINDRYDAMIDDNIRGQERMIFPHISHTRWWAEVFGRTDAEMNGGSGEATPIQYDAIEESTLTAVETADDAVGPGAGEEPSNGSVMITDSFEDGNNLSDRAPAITGELARMDFSTRFPRPVEANPTQKAVKMQMEVELA